MTTRRHFLTTTSAALAGMPLGSQAIMAQGRRPAQHDRVLGVLAAQAKQAARQAARPRPSGEGARQAAAALRVLAAHDVVSAATEQLRAIVAREGRAVFLERRGDASALATELGLPALPAAPAFDYALRERVLEFVLLNGVDVALQSAAAALETAGGNVDRATGVQVVRQYPSAADCASGQWALFMMEILMIAACGPWATPAVLATCPIATGSYLAYRFSLMFMGCM